MPELPEVETTCAGIAPHLIGKHIDKIIIRQYQLRWPIDKKIPHTFKSAEISKVYRRGKYILIKTQVGTLIIHLGMSGHLKIVNKDDLAHCTGQKIHHFPIDC